MTNIFGNAPISQQLNYFKTKIADKTYEFEFYIEMRALNLWAKKNFREDKTEDQNLEFFSAQYLKKFEKLFLIAFEEIAGTKYKNRYPFHETSTVIFYFSNLPNVAEAAFEINLKSSEISIFFSILSVDKPKKEILPSITHELLHILSNLYENEEATIKLIGSYNSKLVSKIEQNKELLKIRIGEIVSDLIKRSPLSNSANESKKLQSQFYRYTEIFWNFVNDSALCIIAIELDDGAYISNCIERDSRRIERLQSIYQWKVRIVELMKINVDKKIYYLSLLNILEFMICFISMPYESVAYGILGEGWRQKNQNIIKKFWRNSKRNEANKIIETFRSNVKKICQTEASVVFLRFYDSYLKIIDAQSIHNDPFDPNVTRQIHNTECLTRAKESYRALNEGFYQLLLSLK